MLTRRVTLEFWMLKFVSIGPRVARRGTRPLCALRFRRGRKLVSALRQRAGPDDGDRVAWPALDGGGDWNDGMDRIGDKGEGESIWLAWFQIATIGIFAPLARQAGHADAADRWQAHADESGSCS